ncbi:uncharacterized protein BO80DRAFT_198357 [Aspergillus ibericus CBS 121593]|uniref:Uncharacterized protein n=1 Tax=Aspergillus ibericus CBS 121593 TaxID=1448316 RepID=A0A395GNS4_9EURO|nr:hypothetical protein BO80DRAFT_198357 [Aspergillus ibericus CBS 121593]RAK97129.1 hypothetical protein BO80DRAFT_198357 [Aspergillus ibericus CBS 121593]
MVTVRLPAGQVLGWRTGRQRYRPVTPRWVWFPPVTPSSFAISPAKNALFAPPTKPYSIPLRRTQYEYGRLVGSSLVPCLFPLLSLFIISLGFFYSCHKADYSPNLSSSRCSNLC